MRPIPKKLEDSGWRELGGLPPLICPECGQDGRHWTPDSLKGPGYFTCADPAVLSMQADALFDIDEEQTND